jgi:hypothetical protein
MDQFSGLLGRLLIGVGLFIVLIGIFFLAGPSIPFLGRLPGDIIIHREHVTLYFPIVTSILVSIILSILLNVFWR